MKIEITGLISTVGPKQTVKNGFRQVIVLHIPELKDDFDNRIKRKEQYYPIQIYSTSETDKRFLDSTQVNAKTKAVCYLNGERWMNSGDRDWNYVSKLNLVEFQQPS